MSRFVPPDIKVLKISQGDTLTVKRRLNSGEQRAMFSRMTLAGVDGEMRVNRLQIGMSKILAYLVDWSLTGDDGTLVAIRDQPIETVQAAIDALDTESYAEIREAIEKHANDVETEREQEKNGLAGENASPVTSPSPSDATGPTSTSAS